MGEAIVSQEADLLHAGLVMMKKVGRELSGHGRDGQLTLRRK